jgi:hypothetical protein
MSNFSGLSAILSVSFIALVTIQMLKDKFEMVENYGEKDENGNDLQQGDAFYSHTTHNTQQNVQDNARAVPVIENLNNLKHGETPFKAQGGFFEGPYIASNANEFSGVSESFSVFMNSLNLATPTVSDLEAIGSQGKFMPGDPSQYMGDPNGGPNFNNGRAANLSLCSQNFGTFGVGSGSVASSLLPAPSQMMEGFSDGCNVTDNLLSNQVFLTPGGVIGTNTNSSSRNSNRDLRSLPANPMLPVGPWNNSTIHPDLLRRPLEGCGTSFGLYGTGANSGGVPTSIQ